MRQNRIGIVGCLAFLLVLFGTSGRAAAVLNCTDLPINSNAKLLALVHAGGFIQGPGATKCALVIAGSGPLSFVGVSPDPTLTFTATSFSILNTTIQIDNSNSAMTFRATNGDTVLDHAILKAHVQVKFSCAAPSTCQFRSSNGSEIISAFNFADFKENPLVGKVFLQDILGDITITGTLFHGGANVEFFSNNGNITIGPCGGTPGQSCEPFTQPPFTPRVLAECGNPPVFPCANLGLLNAAGVKEICFPPGSDVPCNGGAKEKRFEAKKGFIDIEGVTMDAIDHMTFWCGPLGFNGRNATLTTTNGEIRIDCTSASGGPGGNICLQDANLTAKNFIAIATDLPSGIFILGAEFDPAPSFSPAPTNAACPAFPS